VIGRGAGHGGEATDRVCPWSCPGHLARATCHPGPCSRAPLASRDLSVGSLDHVEKLVSRRAPPVTVSYRCGEKNKATTMDMGVYLVSVGRGQMGSSCYYTSMSVPLIEFKFVMRFT
jgi:hypothetical protein